MLMVIGLCLFVAGVGIVGFSDDFNPARKLVASVAVVVGFAIVFYGGCHWLLVTFK